ncbi:HPt (histidine-containing phosphotransfer) domain-containing protein [Mesonia algae]|uniref:HPt (Histidine-containing phosphotransfer) domain-containing protein n=1 Tax=Mesonia algae TaxID=213248 RepID=A0A2W7HYK9_9FLAO|nr:Hpt domain-containing protein [Mesonia algae]PZW39138.1 HPt (histidine-containing phosphotransfer) domain-containing protein [Mesonia algae]
MKIYDLQQVKEMAGGDDDFVVEIVKAFLEELPPDINLMREAVENNNPELAYSVAHKMKPNLQIFGLELLENIKRLESWSKDRVTRKDILEDVSLIEKKVLLACESLKEDFQVV